MELGKLNVDCLSRRAWCVEVRVLDGVLGLFETLGVLCKMSERVYERMGLIFQKDHRDESMEKFRN